MTEQDLRNIANRNFISLLLVVFIGTIGIALPYPIMAPLFLDKYSSYIISTYGMQPEVMLGIALGAYPFGQFVGSPFLGILSDKFGRKRVLTKSLIGALAGFMLCIYTLCTKQFGFLILARFFTGIFEGNIPIARAAVADLSPYIPKTKGFSYINMVLNLGFVVGPLIGGILAETSIYGLESYATPFIATCVFIVITLISILFYFEDTEIVAHHKKDFQSGVMQLPDLVNLKNLVLLLSISFFATLSFDIFYQFSPVYLVKNWSFDSSEIAVATAVLTTAMVVSNLFLVEYSEKKFPLELNIIGSGILYSLGLIIILIPQSSTSIYITFPIVGILISILGTHLPVFISNQIPANKQGVIMGIMMSARFLGDGIIAAVGGFVAAYSYKLPIVLASVISLFAALLFSCYFFGLFILGKTKEIK